MDLPDVSDAHLRISLLGPVRAWDADRELALGSARRRAVLAILAMRANHPVTRNELIDAIWGESAPASVNGIIHTHVYGLRAVLAPARPRPSAGQLIVSLSSGYCLKLSDDAIDVGRFEMLQERARSCHLSHDVAGELAALDAALDLWQGDPLDGIPGPYAATQRARLADLRLSTFERRVRLVLNAGGHYGVVDELHQLSCDHPLREGLHQLLIRALYLAGRRSEAIEEFQRIRAAMVGILGTEPGPELRGLFDEILRDDMALRWTQDDPVGTARPIPLAARPHLPRAQAFVGRQAETTVLRDAVAGVAAGTGHSVWVGGEQGIGKSALLAEVLSDTPGCQVAWSDADEFRRLLPLRTILDCLDVTGTSPDPRRVKLAMTARGIEPSTSDPNLLARCLDPGGTDDLDDAAQTAIGGVVQLVTELCADAPLIIVVDQFQWMDPASMVAWRRLARETQRLPLLLVAAGRPTAHRPELDHLRAALSKARTERLTLGPLPDEAGRQLITSLTGANPGDGLLDLCREATGNPLYTREIVEHLADEDALIIQHGRVELKSAVWSRIPSTMVSALSGHLRHLSDRTQEVLRWASFCGTSFARETLATALQISVPDLSDVVKEAVAEGVLTESFGQLSFRHPIIRRALYDKHSIAIRDAMHTQFAKALAAAEAPTERVAEQLIHVLNAADPWIEEWLRCNVSNLVTRAPNTAMGVLCRATKLDPISTEHREALAATDVRLNFWLGDAFETEARCRLIRAAAGPGIVKPIPAPRRQGETSDPVAPPPQARLESRVS